MGSPVSTPVEGLLWKISAIMTIACPAFYGSSHLPWLGNNPKGRNGKRKVPDKGRRWVYLFLLLLRSLVPDYGEHSVAVLFATRGLHCYLDC